MITCNVYDMKKGKTLLIILSIVVLIIIILIAALSLLSFYAGQNRVPYIYTTPNGYGVSVTVSYCGGVSPDLPALKSITINYGDGNTSVLTFKQQLYGLFNHTYKSAGNYTVNVTVMNAYGRVFNNQTTVTIPPNGIIQIQQCL